jgi:formylglycine-generating enzyme required for sulfatase activity
MIASRIGPYELVERLGAGAMGEVFLARQEAPLRRTVALKLLRAGHDAHDVLRRFERERAALALLSHEHIARVYEAGFATDGRPYFVLEHVAGEPIDAWCTRRALDVPTRLRLVLQVCSAVQHAHQKGLVHRDLKPSNVLVSEASGTPFCKVVDFGIARAVEGELAGATLLTRPGQILGTPAYMSPEQASGVGVDTRADVYSLGALLYELLTGSPPLAEPLERTTEPAEIERVLREIEPRRPSELRPELEEDLDWIVLEALAKEPERRYGSPAELADDLERHLAGDPVAARPPSLRYRLGKLAARHRAATTATVVVLIALVVGLVTTSFLSVAARRAEQRELAIGTDLARLSDLDLVHEAERVADELWPAHPENLPRLEAWFETYARPLEERRPLHRRRWAELEASPPVPGESTWERDTLAELLSALELLLDPEPSRGVAGDLHARIERARRLERSQQEPEHAAVWLETAQAVRSSARYGGLELVPQVGLVPLGPDPNSGLFEFWLPESGVAPEPEVDPGSPGRWRMRGESGLVLVLLPGGPFKVGAQSADPAGWRFDPVSGNPLQANTFQPATLAPFFLSKYEMTQGQWRRVTGTNPSLHVEGGEAHPVERVSWYDAEETLRRLGLVLPTEAQWEYAARGGTDSIWWCGTREEDLQDCANIADRTMDAAGLLRGYICTTSVDDGWIFHAPVGSFRPNPFGLHDTAGNLYEWCLDVGSHYYVPLRSGDGAAIFVPTDADQHIDRGGSFYRPAMQARSAEEDYFPGTTRLDYLGLRPARALDRR